MRRLILVEALSGAALLFSCSGVSILIDAFKETKGVRFPLSESILQEVSSLSGRFQGLALNLYTCQVLPDAPFVLLPRYTPAPDQTTYSCGPFTIDRLPLEKGAAYLLHVDTRSILIVGEGEEVLPSSLMDRKAQVLFLPYLHFVGREGLSIALQCGAEEVFVTHISETDGHQLHKRMLRFNKKGIHVRLLEKTPSGFLL